MIDLFQGKYIPYLATEIMEHSATATAAAAAANGNGDGSSDDALAAALRRGGLAIGDGWVDPQAIVGTYPSFAFAHGLVGAAQRDAMAANVSRFDAALAAADFRAATDIEHAVERFVEDTAGVNAYDVRHLGPYNFSAAGAYLARDDVRAALGIPAGRVWQLSSAAVSAALHDDVAKPASQLIAPLLDAHGLRVLLYNGAPMMLHRCASRVCHAFATRLPRSRPPPSACLPALHTRRANLHLLLL